VLDATPSTDADYNGLRQASNRFKTTVSVCNERMASIEDQRIMRELDETLDYYRLDSVCFYMLLLRVI
jgi:hypothetical protein